MESFASPDELALKATLENEFSFIIAMPFERIRQGNNIYTYVHSQLMGFYQDLIKRGVVPEIME